MGRPRRTIPFFRPSCGEREAAAVADCIRSGWITTGPKVQQFEKAFAASVGVSEAVAVNSCTAAMHLALEAVGIGPGHEVIVPTLTFVATAQAALYAGATPVLVDVNRDTFTIDPAAIEQAISPRTRAIMPMHYGGQPCDLRQINSIAKAHHLTVIEDAAHAVSAACDDIPIGASGNLVCFSFHATKPMTTGEGLGTTEKR
jgi:perosamine synthetase